MNDVELINFYSTKGKSLAQVAAEARLFNLTYGQYVAMCDRLNSDFLPAMHHYCKYQKIDFRSRIKEVKLRDIRKRRRTYS